MLVHNMGLSGLGRIPPEFMRDKQVSRALVYRTLVDNGLLREDQTKEIDDAVVQVTGRSLVAVADLQANGLTRGIAGGIGVTELAYDRIGAVGPAAQHMSIIALGDRDRVTYGRTSVPVPATSSQFEMDARELAAGGGVDLANVEAHSRSVAEKLELTLVCGSDVKLGQNGLFGYTNIDCRHQLSYTNGPWGNSGATPIKDLNAGRQLLRDNGHTGPIVVYIASNLDTQLEEDFKAESDLTLRQRLLALDNITQIKVLPSLPDDEILMVTMTRDTVEMRTAQEITPITWELYGGLQTRWAIVHVGTFTIKCGWARAPQQCGGALPALTTSTGIVHIA